MMAIDTDSLLPSAHGTLEQLFELVRAHDAPGRPAFAGPVGSHLRHVIEHFEALVFPAQPGHVDYDQRPRDRALETSTAVARQRLARLAQELMAWPEHALRAPLLVAGVIGPLGEQRFAVPSTVGRELVFVTSHAVHHLALLQPHCRQHGLTTDRHFGKAPATIAHERATARLHHAAKEAPCTTH